MVKFKLLQFILLVGLLFPINSNGAIFFVDRTQNAEQVPFDNTTNGFTSTDVQGAIEEVNDKVIDIASPGYVFTKSGTVKNTWLLIGIVPSNVTGINFGFYNGVLSSVTIANEAANTFDVQLYEHDGSTYTLLTTLSMVSVRADEFNSTDFGTVNITKGKELAVKVSSGTGKNVIVTVQISGTLSP
jgi:hypothetical protein